MLWQQRKKREAIYERTTHFSYSAILHVIYTFLVVFNFLVNKGNFHKTTKKENLWNLEETWGKITRGQKKWRDSPYKCCQPILLLHPFPWFWGLFNVRVGVVCYINQHVLHTITLLFLSKQLIIKEIVISFQHHQQK